MRKFPLIVSAELGELVKAVLPAPPHPTQDLLSWVLKESIGGRTLGRCAYLFYLSIRSLSVIQVLPAWIGMRSRSFRHVFHKFFFSFFPPALSR